MRTTKREHCVLSLQDFIALTPKWRPVFENRGLLEGSKLQLREANKDWRVSELPICHTLNFRIYLHSTVNYLSLMEQNGETPHSVFSSLTDSQTGLCILLYFCKLQKGHFYHVEKIWLCLEVRLTTRFLIRD